MKNRVSKPLPLVGEVPRCLRRGMVRRARVKLVFVSNYYDGPLSGFCRVDGKEVFWFECFREHRRTRLRSHLLIRLSPEQFKIKHERRMLFEQMVGTHWTYDEKGERSGTFKGRTDDCARFYRENKPEKMDLSQNQIAGWFSR